MWTHLITLYWRTLIDLTPIVNPITSGLFFLTFIEGNPPAFVKRAAIKIGLYMAISLIITLLVGVTILHFFGITLPYIRLAGGLLIFAMGWKMLNRVCRDARERFTPSLVQIDSHCATAN